MVENNLMAAKISKVVFRWANHCVGQAMVAWHKYTVEQLRKRNLMTRIVQCMQKRGAVVALEMWKWNVAGKATRDRIKKVEQSRISKVLMRGCDLWRDQTAKEKKLKAKALKVVRRRKSRGLSEGFQRWRDQTVEGTHFKKREKGVHSKALKLLSRLRYRNLILRWDIWHAAAWGRKHVKSTVSLIAQSMMQQSLKDHLLNWRSKAEKRATKLKIKASNFLLLQTSIAASHSQHRMVNRACLEAWSLQARCARQMANRALKIINRRTGAALAAGLHQWLDVVVAQKRARRQDNKREKLCTRWATRKCLAAWLVYRNKEARYRYIMRRIECRNACWIHSLCRESILSLRANADTLKRERAKDQQRSRLVTSKTLSRRHRYMLAWHVHMRTKVSRRLTIDRIDATRAKRVLARTVCVWLDEQVLESRQQNLFKRIVVKSIRRSLASVVGHWTNVLWSSKTERRRRNDWRIKVLGSNLRGWKAKPFEAWSSRSLQARCARQMANRALKIINRRTGAALAAGLHQWLGVVVAQKRARRQDNKREKLCTRWATRKCLAAWLVYRNKEARYRYIMRRIECRNACWIHSLCRESILSLRANADTLKRERAKDQQRSRLVTSKTLSRRHGLLQGYFMSWSVDTEQVLRMACKTQWALCKCRRRSMGAYMLAWHVHMRTKVSRRRTIDRIDATRTKRVLARTVCVWMEARDRKRVLFRNIMTLLRNILCRCRMLFFRTWRGHSQLLKVGRLTSTAAYYGICDMMHHCSSTLLHQCLARWIEIMGMNAPDGSVMTVGYGVEVTTERSFEDLMLSEGEIRSFNEALLTGVCSSLEISRSCATVLCHQRGSVVATVILFAQDPGTSSTLRGEQVRVRAFLVVFMQRWVHASVHAEMGSRLNGREKLSYTRGITHSCECVWVYLSSVCRASKLARSFNVHGRHGRLPSNCLPAYECLEIPVS
jgi:hypothetical protein